jgi:hypothetical protein
VTKIIHRLGEIPATRGARARRDEARRGVARQAAEEEEHVEGLLFSCSYPKWKSPPYKEVQPLFN